MRPPKRPAKVSPTILLRSSWAGLSTTEKYRDAAKMGGGGGRNRGRASGRPESWPEEPRRSGVWLNEARGGHGQRVVACLPVAQSIHDALHVGHGVVLGHGGPEQRQSLREGSRAPRDRGARQQHLLAGVRGQHIREHARAHGVVAGLQHVERELGGQAAVGRGGGSQLQAAHVLLQRSFKVSQAHADVSALLQERRIARVQHEPMVIVAGRRGEQRLGLVLLATAEQLLAGGLEHGSTLRPELRHVGLQVHRLRDVHQRRGQLAQACADAGPAGVRPGQHHLGGLVVAGLDEAGPGLLRALQVRLGLARHGRHVQLVLALVGRAHVLCGCRAAAAQHGAGQQQRRQTATRQGPALPRTSCGREEKRGEAAHAGLGRKGGVERSEGGVRGPFCRKRRNEGGLLLFFNRHRLPSG
eukprot:scaffold2094_cov239-Pinguiococcus_pyrenoidosus.AAC.5